MNKATLWLKNPSRDYREGVNIYKEVFGIDKSYEFFTKASDPKPGELHFNLLIEKIKVAERRMGNMPVVVKPDFYKKPEISVKPINPGKSPHFVDNHLVEVSKLPKELQEKFFRNKQIMKELAGAHGEMKSATTDETRAVNLELCKALEKEKDENWKAIDAWWENNGGQLAGQPAGQKETETNTDKRIETLRKAIARAKLELKDTTMDLKKRNKRKSKLDLWEKEMKDLKKQKDAG